MNYPVLSSFSSSSSGLISSMGAVVALVTPGNSWKNNTQTRKIRASIDKD